LKPEQGSLVKNVDSFGFFQHRAVTGRVPLSMLQLFAALLQIIHLALLNALLKAGKRRQLSAGYGRV
jgi:hypothetical protein